MSKGEEGTIGLATYSNSEPTVFAYSSIFENLWIHAEIISRDSTTLTPEDERNDNNKNRHQD